MRVVVSAPEIYAPPTVEVLPSGSFEHNFTALLLPRRRRSRLSLDQNR